MKIFCICIILFLFINAHGEENGTAKMIEQILPPPQLIHIDNKNTETLAPFPAYFTPLGLAKRTSIKLDKEKVAVLEWTGKEFRMDEEIHDPLIVRKGLKYYFWTHGILIVRKVAPGSTHLFDSYWGIKKPPEPPSGGDNSDYWKDEDPPNRFDWKP